MRVTAQLFLHVRTLRSGRVIATPIPFVDLSVDAASAEAARSRAIEKATSYVQTKLSGVHRAVLTQDVAADLAEVPITIGQEKLSLKIGVVVLHHRRPAGDVFVVLTPGMARWSVAAESRSRALALAATSLSDRLERTDVGAVLAIEADGDVELDAILVALDPESEPETDVSAMPAPVEGDDLTELAGQGRVSRLDRRDPLLERVLAMLSADGRASVVLVGPGDVGKTTLIHEIAARLHTGEVPPALRGRRLLRTSANELIAGAKFTGMWQDRARQLIAFARETGTIIAMGDPAGIVDAGRWSGSDNNLARVLRPHVESGELRLICEASQNLLEVARTREPGFVELLYRVDVPEPDTAAAREILRAAAHRLQANHDVTFDEDAVEASLDLTRRFEPYRALPGKAVRLLEETAQLSAENGVVRLGREEITRGFARRTGLPVAMLSDRIELRTSEVRAFFEERVLGQADAVEAMVDLIAVIKAGLNDPDKPLSTMFFVGPTGVGKTELSKALAEYLFGSRDRLIRFDMGEFASGDAAARLVGSGWHTDGEGELTRRLREQPFCVLLLDEIEKASRAVFDVLLPALGEGRLTDAAGRTANLSNAIVIMTSNLGATRTATSEIGFAREEPDASRDRARDRFVAEAEAFFRPEFVNRIDQVLAFDPLSRDTIHRIARRELGRLLLREGITRRQLLVEIDDHVVDRLATAGFHSRYGARPLHREIERAVIHPLARLIVEQRPAPGDLIRLQTINDEIAISVHQMREPAPVPRPARDRTESGAKTAFRASTRAVELLEQVTADRDSETVHAVSSELSSLLDQVNAPGFWDDPAGARDAMTRVYQLQTIVDGLDHLRNRAEGLVELAGQVRARTSTGRLSDLKRAVSEIEDQLDVIRLECAGAAAGPEEPRVTMHFAPIGTGAEDWAAALLTLYSTWAERTGREAVTGDERQLVITGPGSYALLAGEAGLHRRERSDRRRQVARVLVMADSHAKTPRATDAEPSELVRIYADGRRTGVRDPRTGVTAGNLDAVLQQGRIDEFILAGVTLRTRRT